ncbi:MAG: DUF4397 domain-containing protein [Chloroflexota bacterium]
MPKRIFMSLTALLLLAGVSFRVFAQDATPESTAEAAPTASVMPGIEAAPSDGNAYLRVAHFSSDAPIIDVYLNGTLAISGLKPMEASAWIPVGAATYTITLAANGGDVSDLFAPYEVRASGGTWQTVALLGSAANGTLHGVVIDEYYGDLLPNTGGFTFLNALEGSPPVNLIRNDVVYYAHIEYPTPGSGGNSSSLREDTGIFRIGITSADAPENVLIEPHEVDIPENAYTLLTFAGTLDHPVLSVIVTDESEVEMARGWLPRPGKLIDSLRRNENLTLFAEALAQAEGAEILNGEEEFTIFAPANFVVDGIPPDELYANLGAYVVLGKYTAGEIVEIGTFTAVNGSTLSVTTGEGGIYVNGVQVIDVNIAASNGVIHMLRGSFAPAA